MLMKFVLNLIFLVFYSNFAFSALDINSVNSLNIYKWAAQPELAKDSFLEADKRLNAAINNPEFILDCWVELPSTPKARHNQIHNLSLKDAILLALRYNPNIQNAELDRITQRYQLRVAQSEFEMQFALAGTALVQNTHFSGIGDTTNKSGIITPEILLKNRFGGELSIDMNNRLAEYGNYDPLVTANFTLPLLRGFGKVNEFGLLNAIDHEHLNKFILQQTVMDQITDVITAYQALILSSNNLNNQKKQLADAKKSFRNNEQKIKAGQLEPTANIQQSYQIESLKIMVEQASNDFAISSQKLLQTIGLSPDLHLAVPSDISLNKIVVPNLEQSIDLAFKNNTEYLALNLSVTAANRAYLAAKNAQLWQLDLNANFQTGITNDVKSNIHGISSLYNGQNIIKAAGVTLSIPIRDVQRKNELITAKVQLEKERLKLNTFKQNLTALVTNTVANIKSYARRYELAKKQVLMAERSYNLEKKKQDAGLVSSFEVNNTQNQLLLAQSGLIGAKIAYLNQLATLHRILGTTLDEWQIKLRYCG